MNKLQNLINHIALVVDGSGSMAALKDKVVEVFDAELKILQTRSVELNQETRISIYILGTNTLSGITCLVSDMDVMRFTSLKGHYVSYGNTPLIEATSLAIEDMELFPTKYGDHSFLVYVLTDGQENASNYSSKQDFPTLLKSLSDEWTIACLVPNQHAKRLAISHGFSSDSLGIWDVSEQGMQKQGKIFTSSVDTYMVNRAAGIKGTKTFFQPVNAAAVTRTDIQSTLTEISTDMYEIIMNDSTKAVQISDLVKKKTQKGVYIRGHAYYALVKKETIQANKTILIQDKKNGKMYGGQEARNMLKLSAGIIQVSPGDLGMWNVFVRSDAPNRNIIPNQHVVVVGKNYV